MRTQIAWVCALGTIVSFSGCRGGRGVENAIPVIGVDENGNPTEVMIGEADYSERLEQLMSSYIDSTLPVLNRSVASPKEPSPSDWMIRTVTLGVGINAEIGVGSAKVGAFPRFRLIFTNSKDPTVP
jgi:hypothetical protein